MNIEISLKYTEIKLCHSYVIQDAKHVHQTLCGMRGQETRSPSATCQRTLHGNSACTPVFACLQPFPHLESP